MEVGLVEMKDGDLALTTVGPPKGPPIYLIAIIAFLLSTLASIYLLSRLG
jgi:hypothetical protein